MSQQTCECKKCKKQFIMYIKDKKICPNCGSKNIKIIDIAF